MNTGLKASTRTVDAPGMISRGHFLRIAWALQTFALLGCRTQEWVQPHESDLPAPRVAEATTRWSIRDAESHLGWIQRYETEDSAPQLIYSVQNVWSQELGWIDALGRAFALELHGAPPRFLGSGTLAEGAARVLELEGSVELSPDSHPAPMPASAPR